MAHIGRHPAPGLGELIPGSFVVPSNPIVSPSYIPHIGELLPASFPIPQNPLIAAITSPPGYGLPNQPGLGCGCAPAGCGSGMCGGAAGLAGLGADCGCIGGMCGCGMGQLDFLGGSATLIVGAALLGLMWLLSSPGGKEYHQERAAAKRAYEDRLAKARSEHRGLRRLTRGAARGIRSRLKVASGERDKVTHGGRGAGYAPVL